MCVCVRVTVYNSPPQHRTVLIIFHLTLLTLRWLCEANAIHLII